MAPVLMVRHTFLDIVDDAECRRPRQSRSLPAVGRAETATPRIGGACSGTATGDSARCASGKTVPRWPISRSKTEELLRDLEKLNRRLLPAFGFEPQPVGNEVKQCRARDPPDSAVRFHTLLFGQRPRMSNSVDKDAAGDVPKQYTIRRGTRGKVRGRATGGSPSNPVDVDFFDDVIAEHMEKMATCKLHIQSTVHDGRGCKAMRKTQCNVIAASIHNDCLLVPAGPLRGDVRPVGRRLVVGRRWTGELPRDCPSQPRGCLGDGGGRAIPGIT